MTAALLDAANEALRNAVRDRLESTPADDPKMRGYTPLAGCQPAQECAAQVLADAWRDEGCCDGGRCQPKTVVVGQGVLNEWAEFERDEPRQTGDGVKGDASAGTTAKFGTGAIRSDTFEEFRYDLVSPIGLREVARACAEGAEKYGDWNWEKGMPVHDLLNHAIAHIYGFLSGDRSEPHLGHAAWNLLAAIHSHELWPHLNDGNLRSELCRAPHGLNACDPPAKGV